MEPLRQAISLMVIVGIFASNPINGDIDSTTNINKDLNKKQTGSTDASSGKSSGVPTDASSGKSSDVPTDSSPKGFFSNVFSTKKTQSIDNQPVNGDVNAKGKDNVTPTTNPTDSEKTSNDKSNPTESSGDQSADDSLKQLVPSEALKKLSETGKQDIEVNKDLTHENCGSSEAEKPKTEEQTTQKQAKCETTNLKPRARFHKESKEIIYKYEIDFKKPIFGMKGFIGSIIAGFLTPDSNRINYEDEQSEGTYKLYLYGEFGLKKENTVSGVSGEVSIEAKRKKGEFKIAAGFRLNVLGKEKINKQATLGNNIPAFPPACVSIPQLAGIQFCQVAFDFTFRTNFTGSVCLKTEVKHIACPIPLLTIQYHCLNFGPRRVYVTKSTHRSGFINPNEIAQAAKSFKGKIPTQTTSTKQTKDESPESPSSKQKETQSPLANPKSDQDQASPKT